MYFYFRLELYIIENEETDIDRNDRILMGAAQRWSFSSMVLMNNVTSVSCSLEKKDKI